VLQGHAWPGNIRELRNTIERIVILFDTPQIEPQQVESMLNRQNAPTPEPGPNAIPLLPVRTLREYSQEVVQRILESNRWNKAATARSLGISRATLYSYLSETEPA
jgi:DNA-binding NtrC family response regulator